MVLSAMRRFIPVAGMTAAVHKKPALDKDGMAARTPVTVITGYLGAGKTTLLRRIISESTMRLAVVMNEFGQMNVDGRVVEGRNIRMVELLGGCVCCSLAGEFGEAIAELLDKAQPEWIVIETTGVAEPAALAHDIAENMPRVRLDSIVTVVDADSMLRFPRLGHTGREQIELADMVILNKADLVPAEKLEAVRRGVAEINGRAEVLEAEHCAMDTAALFGIGRDAPAPPHKAHETEFEWFVCGGGRLDHGKFLQFMEGLPEGVYRAKGFALTEKGGFLVSYVAGRLSLEEFACGKTEMVFIGKGACRHMRAVCAALDGMKRI